VAVKTALVIGATGLVGAQATRLLLDDPEVEGVSVFARRSTGLSSDKLTEHIVDFDRLAGWGHRLVGDVLFSAMGTTRKQAGGRDAQYRVDFSYQHEVARAAADNGVPTLVLVSSAGANARSPAFYPRIKGELEEAVAALGFRSVCILRPSVLVGQRERTRPGEEMGAAVADWAGRWLRPARKWRPIPAETVARAMIRLAHHPPEGTSVHSLDEVFERAAGR
jgi:uncharacterized protein YbjT (DUF2867 family)